MDRGSSDAGAEQQASRKRRASEVEDAPSSKRMHLDTEPTGTGRRPSNRAETANRFRIATPQHFTKAVEQTLTSSQNGIYQNYNLKAPLTIDLTVIKPIIKSYFNHKHDLYSKIVINAIATECEITFSYNVHANEKDCSYALGKLLSDLTKALPACKTAEEQRALEASFPHQSVIETDILGYLEWMQKVSNARRQMETIASTDHFRTLKEPWPSPDKTMHMFSNLSDRDANSAEYMALLASERKSDIDDVINENVTRRQLLVDKLLAFEKMTLASERGFLGYSDLPPDEARISVHVEKALRNLGTREEEGATEFDDYVDRVIQRARREARGGGR